MHIHSPSPAPLLFWIGLVAATLNKLSLSDILIIVGAIAFAGASARNGRMKLLRDTNTDLLTRNQQLEAENATMKTQPNLEQHAALLAALEARMAVHDKEMMNIAERQRIAFEEIIRELRIIHLATVPPEVVRD